MSDYTDGVRRDPEHQQRLIASVTERCRAEGLAAEPAAVAEALEYALRELDLSDELRKLGWD